jgi:hypothetical protein
MLTMRALLLARPSEPMALVFDMCGHKNSCTCAAVLYRIEFFDAAKVQTFSDTARKKMFFFTSHYHNLLKITYLCKQ